MKRYKPYCDSRAGTVISRLTLDQKQILAKKGQPFHYTKRHSPRIQLFDGLWNNAGSVEVEGACDEMSGYCHKAGAYVMSCISVNLRLKTYRTTVTILKFLYDRPGFLNVEHSASTKSVKYTPVNDVGG